jgi:secreted trypsin-like serine protease
MTNKLIYSMILATCSLVVGCGAKESSSDLDIVGGRKATWNDPFVRHVVALVTTNGQHFCTGSLVGKQLVLTAAHCVRGGKPFVIGFGLKAQGKDLKRQYIRTVESVVMNREYVHLDGVVREGDFSKGKAVSDVAFIKMKNDAPKGFVPVKLMPPNWNFQKGSPMVMAGYGVTATPKPDVKITSPSELMDGKKTLSDNGVLRTVGTRYAGRNDKGEIVLASRGFQGACSGDSGGPAFVATKSKKSGKTLFYQVGVAARSNCYNSASYTDVRAHSEWIKKANRYVNDRK